MWLTRIAISRPVLIWMALIAIGMLGGISYTRLPAELNPRVAIPTVTITTVYPGAGPQEVETLVTRPLEDAAGSVSGARNVFSSSQESVSVLSIDLRMGTDLDKAVADIREKTSAVQLPTGAHAPVIAKLDINAQPILYVALSTNRSLRDLRNTIDKQVAPRLARVAGVAGIQVVGGEQREVRVAADTLKLDQAGITLSDVVNAIRAAGQDVPAGSLTQGNREVTVRTIGALASVEQIRAAQILVAPSQGMMTAQGGSHTSPTPAAPLTVGDVATVTETSAPRKQSLRVNGKDGIALVVAKAVDANTIAVVDAVKADLAEMRKGPLKDCETVIARDESVVVRDALEDVNMTLLLGAILAMGVVYLFLRNLRGTLIVALALPSCLVATFLVIHLAGFTLNQMTLLALSLSVGILIDDSIVVLESITRHLRMGESPEEAAYNGRTEIGFADITTTLVDVVVFLPIGFMSGIVGSFFREFGLTIVVATLFSLIVSFTVTPALAAKWYRQGEKLKDDEVHGPLQHFYKRLIYIALNNRGLTIALGFTSLIVVLLVTTPHLGAEFLPATDQGQISVTVELSPDASLDATQAAVEQIETKIGQIPDIKSTVSTVGEILGGFGAIPQRGPQFAQISVRLAEKAGLQDRILGWGATPTDMRSRSDEAVATDIRNAIREVKATRIAVSTVRTVAESGAPVQLQIRGDNLENLEAAAVRLSGILEGVPGVVAPDVSSRPGRPEARVTVDTARAAALGVPQAQVGLAVREAVSGNSDSVLRRTGEELPVRVYLAGYDQADISELAKIPVASRDGKAVTLGEVGSVSQGAGPTAIERVNGQRMVTLSAHLAPSYTLGNVQGAVNEQLKGLDLGDASIHWSGEAEVLDENVPAFALAIGMAVILVYLLMASLFNSLLNPFIIMFTLPMALAGAIGALAITGESLSLVSVIGIIMLTGLMGRNAILLIDYIRTLRARGMPRAEAIAEAGATRLRPILMTTIATIVGMLPVALRIGRASEMRAPMAIVVIGGLLVSTVLTLVVIPALYTLFDDLVARRRRAGG